MQQTNVRSVVCLMADQMRVLKQRLNEMVPNLKIFLDVDDLKSGKGAESVDTSLNILVMVSDGYFRSPNCAPHGYTRIN